MSAQESLFDLGPTLDPEQSQWFTPRWIADRMVGWVEPSGTVIEPSAGGGALIDALLRTGFEQRSILAVELDPRWVAALRSKFPGVHVTHGDFLNIKQNRVGWKTCLMNPPYEDDLHTQFILHALCHCDVVIALVPSSTEYSATRDRDLWASKAMVTRRARLPNRVKFGGENQASFDSVCLRIVRRHAPRKPGERIAVEEEVWLQT